MSCQDIIRAITQTYEQAGRHIARMELDLLSEVLLERSVLTQELIRKLDGEAGEATKTAVTTVRRQNVQLQARLESRRARVRDSLDEMHRRSEQQNAYRRQAQPTPETVKRGPPA